MVRLKDQFYRMHVFICTNIKDIGKCCGQEAVPEEMLAKLKKLVKELGVSGENAVRISKSGCLGRCSEGPCAVIYPQGKWFNLSNQADELLHLIENYKD